MNTVKFNITISTIFIILVFLALPEYADAQSNVDLYNQGNDAYRDGNYELAIELYQQALQGGAKHPAIYYNLGNAYFKANRIGPAILNFQRALILSPRDKSIKNNLEYAKLLTFDKIDSIYEQNLLFKIYYRLLSFFNFRELNLIIFIISVLITASLMIFIVSNSYPLRKILLRLLILFGILELLVVGLFVLKSQNPWQSSAAVVMVSKLDITSSPARDSELLFTIHEGLKIAIEETRGEWAKILLEDGRHGWVPNQSIERIREL
ncbi:tetratricopeptide repeat protein [bacterium]|nr:tetratricopeptide repeat protein [bacterium]